MDKKTIKANIQNLTAEQLFDEIKQGNITLEELEETGDLTLSKKKKIRELLAAWETQRIEQEEAKDKADEEAWEHARYGNELKLIDYVTSFPNGKHVKEAKEKIAFLEKEREKARAMKEKVLEDIRTNSNSKEYSPDKIKDYLNNQTLSESDLLECEIPREVIEMVKMKKMDPPELNLGKTPESIPAGYTEVYFWGVFGSGKTTALAAILSTADKKGYLDIAMGPSYNYMTQLKNIFAVNPAILPAPSPVDTTQYLPFTLKKKDEKHGRSISLIELSGEVFQCFYDIIADQKMPSGTHERTFKLLQKFVKSKNRKIHFFFIDYWKKNEVLDQGRMQSDYLKAAAKYFEQYKIFKKTSDAIYVVLTKSDLLPCSEEEREKAAGEYLRGENSYASFINSLRKTCIDYSINNKRLLYEPFSLGTVYFNQICDFDEATAEKIIDILFERVPIDKGGSIVDILNR